MGLAMPCPCQMFRCEETRAVDSVLGSGEALANGTLHRERLLLQDELMEQGLDALHSEAFSDAGRSLQTIGSQGRRA